MMHRALRLLRTYHDLKQGELAECLGISGSYLSEIEGGTKTPSLDLLQKYAGVFRIPVSSILLFSESIVKGQKRPKKLQVIAADKILRLLEYLDERETVKRRA